jgi:hypothetical protein
MAHMAAAPNPFADDLPADSATPVYVNDQRSNPYAPPTVVAPVHPDPEPVQGVWRDGDSLVIHETGCFPDRCVLTNEPERARYQQLIQWSYPIDWYQRKHTFEFGLSDEGLRQWSIKRRWIKRIQAGTFLLFMTIFFFNTARERWSNFLVITIPTLIVALLILRASESPALLSFRKHKDGYFWLRGAKPPFLNSLPPWPGVTRLRQ